jgi:hypothetical protein
MLGLLIAIVAAAFGAVVTVILLVAWGIRREDAWLTMGSPPPDRLTRVVRRMTGLYTLGIAAPGQDQPPSPPGHPSFTTRHTDPGPFPHPTPRTTEPV